MRPRAQLAWFGLSLSLPLLTAGVATAAPAPVGLHALARQASQGRALPPRWAEPGELRLTPRSRTLPVYPPAPRRAGLEGRVALEGRLLADGTLDALRCVSCEDDRAGFAAAALEAISSWSYEPLRGSDGKPVTVSIRFDVEFRQGP